MTPEKPTETTTIYNASLTHGGNLLHKIPLVGLTAQELKLLRDIHDAGNIVDVKEVSSREIVLREELFRIVDKYASREDYEKVQRIRARAEKLFGVSLEGFDEWQQNLIDESMQSMAVQQAKHRAESERIDAENKAKADAALREQIRAELLEEMTKPGTPASGTTLHVKSKAA